MRVKVSEATGAVLDWLVAKCEGVEVMRCGAGPSQHLVYIPSRSAYKVWHPSVRWSQAGPIIDRELIDVLHVRQSDLSVAWDATFGNDEVCMTGPTLPIAAMRCYVASKLGEEVEVPDELTGSAA